MNAPTLWQHDPRWKNQRLGTKDGTTIGGYGCGITDITMMNAAFNPGDGRLVNNIDDIFTNQGGYVAINAAGKISARSPQAGANLIDWGKIPQLLPNCGYVARGNYPDGTPADIARLRNHLDGGGLAILQVYWQGNKNLMHFVLAVDHDGDDIIVNDPEKGDRVAFSSKRFGTGRSRDDIYVVHFFADAIPNTPPPVSAPAPATPAPSNPEPGRGAAPVETPKEEEVTQAQHDSAMAEMKALFEGKITQLNNDHEAEMAPIKHLLETQASTITRLTDELAKYVPEYVATWQDGPVCDVLSKHPLILVDFADKEEPLEFPANTIFTVQGQPFTVAGKRYWRTKNSVVGGYFYGVPADPAVTEAYNGPATTIPPLNASQQLHAMVADSAGWWEKLISNLNPFRRKK